MSGAWAPWAPGARGVPRPAVRVRPAGPRDLAALAAVMASRGGTPEDHRSAAVRLLSTAPVLLVSEDTGTAPPKVVGWSGATRVPLQPGEPARWLTAGLTIIPEARRAGIGRLLLRAVGDATASAEGGPLYSVVNARNQASLALHEACDFRVLATGPRFAGIEFDGGVGVLLVMDRSLERD